MITPAAIRVKLPIISGKEIDTDHSESLYGAISAIAPAIHQQDQIAISRIFGERALGKRLRLSRKSYFFVQCDASQIPMVLPLAGKAVQLRNDHIRFGVPQLMMIRPAGTLFCRLFVMRNAIDEEKAVSNLRSKLLDLLGEESAHLDITPLRRRIVRIHGKKITGFGIRIAGLTDEQSVIVQSQPLSGRRKYGCGLFVPAGGKDDARD